MKLSVVIPVYNEEATIAEAVRQVHGSPYGDRTEIIVVDDGSTDGTVKKVESLPVPGLVLVKQTVNRGKGAAVRKGIETATGDIILVQDADLEYTPEDYPALIGPIEDGKADVVYGSRFLGGGTHRVLFYWHSIGNHFLTILSNMFTNLNLTDMEVGLKAFRSTIIKQVRLEQERFGFEPEVTARIARLNCRIYEVPISYYGRTYAEGKKISWKDGVSAVWCIIKYGLFK